MLCRCSNRCKPRSSVSPSSCAFPTPVSPPSCVVYINACLTAIANILLSHCRGVGSSSELRGRDTYARVAQFARHAIKRWGYCYSRYLHEYVYISSAFRNASSACSSSNTHSVVIAPILLGEGGQGPPYWNIGAPYPPLPLPLNSTVVLCIRQSVDSLCRDGADTPIKP